MSEHHEKTYIGATTEVGGGARGGGYLQIIVLISSSSNSSDRWNLTMMLLMKRRGASCERESCSWEGEKKNESTRKRETEKERSSGVKNRNNIHETQLQIN